MTFRGKIAAVSYLNTVPFIYGLRSAEELHASLVLSPPSQCAADFLSGVADLALVPVEAIRTMPDARVVGSYCLGAAGNVRTVELVSDVPLAEIKTIYRDCHSVTSARLVALVCDELWGIAPRFEPLSDYTLIDRRRPGDAFLLIGDKVFGYEGRFPYVYDMADAWCEMTGLPFVFAAWIARNGVPQRHIDRLNEALAYGVAHIPEAIEALGHADKPYALEYLTKNIDYLFDTQKQRALSLFWDKSMKYAPRVNPG